MTREKDRKRLLKIHHQRLQILKEQQALYGSSVDPRIPIEIKNINAEIKSLEDELDELQETSDEMGVAPPCPYPGMVPFSAVDARFFYGRKKEINQLLQRLRYHRRLFVIGPSGSGKSSLIFAGVLSKLPGSNYFRNQSFLVRSMRPGSEPLVTLAQTLEGDLDEPAQAVNNLLAKAEPSSAQHLLLVIDQLEELFTQVERVKQSEFISALHMLNTVEKCKSIIALRADFYQDLMNSDFWPVNERERLEIAPLRGDMLRQAIEQPAADMGIKLEAGLVARLAIDAADEPGALPLIQETMVQLWETMDDRVLSLNAYEQLGSDGQSGLAVAIADRAEAILDDFSPDQIAITRRIFLRLVQFRRERADTRRQQPVAALRAANDDPKLFEKTLYHLADNRLLTLSGHPRSRDRQVDIAHEALFSGWPTLQGWLSERREAERTRRRLTDRATEWVDLGRGRGGLLDEIQLRAAEDWLKSPDAVDLGYDQLLAEFVQVSREIVEKTELERETARQELATVRQLAILGTAMSALQNRINNTLSIIVPNIIRLRRRVDSSDKTILEILEMIERNTRYTSDYIHRIQDALQETEVQSVNINASLQEAQLLVWQKYQPQTKLGLVKVVYSLDDSLPIIEASVSQITEIFRNLIENSYRAMSVEGGTLTIISRQAGDWLEVEIQDTGPGLSSEILDKLFDKPVPSSDPAQGTGLGLWLSALLLQKYTGEIAIKKTGSAGTTMLVRLPVGST